jgi:hypothetical protein
MTLRYLNTLYTSICQVHMLESGCLFDCLFSFLMVLRFELKALHLLGRLSIT